MSERIVFLKYIGAGSYLPDVPARDLTKEEAEYNGVGRLIDSRLYEYASVMDNPKYKGTMADVRDEIAKNKLPGEPYPYEPKKRGKQ